MSSEGSPELVFEFTTNGKASGTTVTARIGDDVVAVDRIDVAKAKARSEFLDQVCSERPGIKRRIVEQLLKDQAAQYAKRQAESDEKTPEPESEKLLLKMPQHVRDEARAMMESPDLMKSVMDDVSACGVAGERELVSSIYLTTGSRLDAPSRT